MRLKFYFLTLAVCLAFLSVTSYPKSSTKEGLRAYIFFTFESPNMFRDSTFKNEIKSKIMKIFEEQGINIIRTENPNAYEEYKLNVYITIKDSLIIEAQYIGISGPALSYMMYPRESSKYKNEYEIYNTVKKYIDKNILKKTNK